MGQHDINQLLAAFAGFWVFTALVILALTVFWVVELVDILRREVPDPTLKIVWLLVVFFLHGLGAVIYYFVGKPQGRLPGPSY